MVKEGYKETEVGVIPEDWSVRKIGDFTNAIAGGTPSTYRQEYWNGKIPWMSSGELNKRRIYDVLGRITTLGYNNSSTHLVPQGCVLIGLAGQGKTRGTVAVNYIELCTNQSIAAMFPSSEHSTEFLYQNLWSRYEELRELSSGDGGRGGLNLSIIKNLYCPFPKLEEQQKIAEALSDMDSLISSLEKLIEKKKAIKQGTMQELLTGKKRLAGFSGDWIEKSIYDFGRFISGSGFPLKYQGILNEEYPFYKVSDFNNEGNERIMKTANNYISKGITNVLSCNIIPKSSIIFAKIGAAIFLERKRITSCDCCIDNNMMAFQPYDSNTAKFFCYFFQTIVFGDLIEATALPSLSAKVIGEIKRKFPPSIKEQKAIASILSDMDNEIEKLEKKLEKCKKIKQGMMQELLTGKIRLI